MNLAISLLAPSRVLLRVVKAAEAPIPEPPTLAGVLGILGIYLGSVMVEGRDLTVHSLAVIGFANDTCLRIQWAAQ